MVLSAESTLHNLASGEKGIGETGTIKTRSGPEQAQRQWDAKDVTVPVQGVAERIVQWFWVQNPCIRIYIYLFYTTLKHGKKTECESK